MKRSVFLLALAACSASGAAMSAAGGSSSGANGDADAAANANDDGGARAPIDASAATDATDAGDSDAGVEPFGKNESLQRIAAGRNDTTGAPVTIAVDWITPSGTPTRVAILLVGDDGVLDLIPAGFKKAANSFLVRTREMYASAGYAVAIVDAPSDHPQGLDNFRGSADHASDIGAVIAWARGEASAPVWLVGTSRGTISAANAAAQNTGNSAPNGVVLTSAINNIPSDATDQESIGASTTFVSTTLTTLFVHNTLDTMCKASPLGKAQSLAAQIASATFTTVTGGAEVSPNPCDALTYHGFYGPSSSDGANDGLDAEVVPMITSFIDQH